MSKVRPLLQSAFRGLVGGDTDPGKRCDFSLKCTVIMIVDESYYSDRRLAVDSLALSSPPQWKTPLKLLGSAHRLRVAQKYLTEQDVNYFLGAVTKMDSNTGNQITFSQALKSALEEVAKGTAPTETMIFAPKDAQTQLLQEIIDSESIRPLLAEEALKE
ncbi:hypothetical protein BJX62DRAFT_241377 [Aspergillus germanicus]